MLRLAAFVCLLPLPAAAIGPCEGLVDTARVMAISESTREVAVRRAVETCTATPGGDESRTLLRYVELRNLDTGKVNRRFAPDKQTAVEPLSEALKQPVGSWADYTRALKTGRFQDRPAKAKNRFCAARLSIESGTLAAVIDGRDSRNKPIRATVRLLPGVEPGNHISRLARLWFARNGSVLVADVEAAVRVDRGDSRRATVHRSLVRIIGPREAPVLRGCATPRPGPKRPPRR